MQDLETTIRRHLVNYLAGNSSLDEFTDWLVGATWNIEHAESTEARNLAYSIDLALAEASSGLLTLDELRTELSALVNQVTIRRPDQRLPLPAAGVSLQGGSKASTFTRWLLGDPTTTRFTPGLSSVFAQAPPVAAL
jgi:hypothetical protein